ncbi:phosphoadenylyl-sulfate reductase [Methylacidimicrobium tartarophylax]|uniref:Phosphoadenosine 5'-phosphosulfate reductase n=1 Tax=Methylacidimicrobium tartarophylax TaxID=1041768 RepID=A0A5E6MCL9_9BACT|nr:phosphoadenylyl-sulfate reductase [Methylacidimicrobium tartarophylax]VVM06075.1 phosphoadenosine phosphosulfate reductase [Methylacidimicrobium tartarophylax]
MEKPSTFEAHDAASAPPDLEKIQAEEGSGSEGKAGQAAESVEAEAALEGKSAVERLQWAFDRFGDRVVLSSSFGIQAAVLLHLATRLRPEIPVIFVDTGYLFPETYRYADLLAERLGLRLYVVQAPFSAAWFEARYGRLWENGVEGLNRYNELRKVEPMRRALAELHAHCWLAGVRRTQARTRADLPVLQWQGEMAKMHPIVDWSDEQVEAYLDQWAIPRHPLASQGYVSVGDVPTSRPWEEGMLPEETRFFGWKRECGLHPRSS